MLWPASKPNPTFFDVVSILVPLLVALGSSLWKLISVRRTPQHAQHAQHDTMLVMQCPVLWCGRLPRNVPGPCSVCTAQHAQHAARGRGPSGRPCRGGACEWLACPSWYRPLLGRAPTACFAGCGGRFPRGDTGTGCGCCCDPCRHCTGGSRRSQAQCPCMPLAHESL